MLGPMAPPPLLPQPEPAKCGGTPIHINVDVMVEERTPELTNTEAISHMRPLVLRVTWSWGGGEAHLSCFIVMCVCSTPCCRAA